MAEYPNHPKEYDAVLGGQNPLIDAAVLGGIEGIKKRLASPILEVRIAALTDVLKYGEKGLDLVLQSLQDESITIKNAAFSLLKDRQEAKVKQQLLDKFLGIFEFEVVTVDIKGQINSRRRHFARYFTEDLGNGASLEMVLIPGGTFLMGSPKTEAGRFDHEDPQHLVTVAPFFIGKYQVTRAQWQAVAALPKIKRDLKPIQSRFTRKNLPVKTVSWLDAVEFCARVSQKTQREYRLPSEAEWEYACRAGTTTGFHFGESITTDLASYNGNRTYGSAPRGTYRGQTTPVGSFGVANNFGLYDMHGKVCEWCADHWHDNYQDAPTDGSAWLIDDNDKRSHVLRGGAWYFNPEHCRSAYRNYDDAGSSDILIGFRVVCAAAWTQ